MNKPSQPKAQTKTTTTKDMSDGQRAYEAKRAAKAGMSVDRWLEQKRRAEAAEAAARLRAAAPAAAAKRPGLLARLLDRAHKPL